MLEACGFHNVSVCLRHHLSDTMENKTFQELREIILQLSYNISAKSCELINPEYETYPSSVKQHLAEMETLANDLLNTATEIQDILAWD